MERGTELKLFLDNGDQHVGGHGTPDLRLHRVLAGAAGPEPKPRSQEIAQSPRDVSSPEIQIVDTPESPETTVNTGLTVGRQQIDRTLVKLSNCPAESRRRHGGAAANYPRVVAEAAHWL